MGTIRDEILDQSGGGGATHGRTPPLALAGLMPRPVEVLGLRLGPMTMAHWLALQACGSPLVTPGAKIQLEDVVRAAAILSMEPLAAYGATADELVVAAGEIAAGLNPGGYADLADAVTRCIGEGFATALPFNRRGADFSEKKAPSGGSLSSPTPCSTATGAA